MNFDKIPNRPRPPGGPPYPPVPPPLPKFGSGADALREKVEGVASKLRGAMEDFRRKVSNEIRHERTCPRPGCAELNPLGARFCRRCGVTLGGSSGMSANETQGRASGGTSGGGTPGGL